MVSGDLGRQPASTDDDRHGGSFNKHGKYFIGTYEDGAKPIGDQVIGEIRSPVFIVDAERLAMLVGGGKSIATTYVALCDAETARSCSRPRARTPRRWRRSFGMSPSSGASAFT